jgi:hypothetical protein
MKKPLQQVNLYHPMFHKQEVQFSAVTISIILGVLLFAYIVTYTATWIQLQGVENQLQAAQSRKANMESNAAMLSEQAPNAGTDKGLLQRLEALQRQRDLRKEATAVLESSMEKEQKVLSSFFSGLARQNIDGLWLQRIYILNGGDELELGGRVTHPELVPQLLGKLSQEEAYKGHAFEVLSLERGEEEQPFVSFNLSTISRAEQQ